MMQAQAILVVFSLLIANTIAGRSFGLTRALEKEVNNPIDGTLLQSQRYEGSEHRAGSNELGYLTMMVGPQGESLANYNNEDIRLNYSTSALMFTNANNVTLGSYGDLVALSADFFGAQDPATVICSASSDPTEEISLFQAAFSQLWTCSDQNLIDSIIQQFNDEDQAVANLPSHVPPYDAYAGLGENRWADIGISLTLWNLLVNNFDHFGTCAANAYTVGHRTAMQTAREAGMTFNASSFNSLSLEERGAKLSAARAALFNAYAMNAFSDHFLTDMFAAGHVRTPRRSLVQVCGAEQGTPILGSGNAGLAAQWMHDEDNRNGLWVANQRGDTWFTLGDDSFYDPRNAQSRALLREAVQISRNEVYAAFNGATDSFGALLITPDPSLLVNYNINNTCPLFILDPSLSGGVLVRDPWTSIRPPAYYNHSLNPSTTCNYQTFTPSDCPSVLASIGSAWFKYHFNFDFALSPRYGLSYNSIANAWVTSESTNVPTTTIVSSGSRLFHPTFWLKALFILF